MSIRNKVTVALFLIALLPGLANAQVVKRKDVWKESPGKTFLNTASNNVGVGTNNPTEKLDVAGSVKATSFVGDGSALTNLPAPSQFWIKAGSNLSPASLSDNVGIGTTSPTQKLEVTGTVKATAFSGDGAALTNLPVMTQVWSRTGSNLSPSTAGDTVGIGTANPAAGLQVGAGTATLGTLLDATGALIKGNLEVDGKIYGDGSMLTNLPTGGGSSISGLHAGFLSKSSSGSTIVDSVIYDDGANVSIGTSRPNTALTVSSYAGGIESNFKPAGIGGCDVNTAYLLHFDGVATSANCNGTVNSASTFNGSNSVAWSSTQSKFGGQSLYWGATPSANNTGWGVSLTCSVMDVSDAGGPYTLEWWIWPHAGANATTYSLFGKSGGYWGWNYPDSRIDTLMYVANGKANWSYYTGGGYNFAGTTTIPEEQWSHIEMSFDGTTKRIFVNGHLDAQSTQAHVTNTGSTQCYLGAYGGWAGGSSYPWTMMYGYMDEFRYSKIARHTADFTPAAGAFTPSYGTPFFRLSDNGSPIADIMFDGSDLNKVKIKTGTTPRITIQPDGNIGIGTVAPVGVLDVNRLMTVLSSGSVGIGTVAPGKKLEVNGTFRATDYFAGDGTQGITDTTSYWMCRAADCSTKCQANIKDGLITACP